MTAGTQIESLIEQALRHAGAVRSEVTRFGVATHWRTEREADKAVGKFRDMGLLFIEKFRDNNLFAVFAKFPVLEQIKGPVINGCQIIPGGLSGILRRN